MDKKRLLIADDDAGIRAAVCEVFSDYFDISTAGSKEEALHAFDTVDPHAVILDIEFHGQPHGLEILRQLRIRSKKVIIVMMTGSTKYQFDPLTKEADRYFIKPCDFNDVRDFFIEKGILEGDPKI